MAGSSHSKPEVPEYPIPGILNLCIALVQLVAFAVIMTLAGQATAWWQVVGLAAAMAVVGNSIYSIVHEAEHGILYANRTVNDAVGILMALFFPAPFHLIRQGHLGHHRRNRSDDEAFDLYFPGDRVWLKWLILYGILTGFYWGLVVLSNFVAALWPSLLKKEHFDFDRPSAAFMESLNPKYWLLIRLEALAAIVLHTVIIVATGCPPLIYLAVYFGFGFTWSAMQYVHHFGTERHVLRGARNVWLWAPIDLVWLHHNWHLLHHEHPTVPWVYLPELARDEGQVERSFLVSRYLAMWRGPRPAKDRVENRYAGKVIN
ncbi:MAG: fatty acid desaturase [Planctomycetales bacterium]|nr:fatty acid desaturase [Planctomycetales bacterium]